MIHALQMWRAQSTSMRYGDLKDGGGMARIEKDKVGVCACVLRAVSECACAVKNHFMGGVWMAGSR